MNNHAYKRHRIIKTISSLWEIVLKKRLNLWRLIIFFNATCFVAGCEKSESTDPDVGLTSANAPFELSTSAVNFYRDLAYDDATENVFDLFLPSASTPTGLVIYFHGGGFINGDKSTIYASDQRQHQIDQLLSQDIAFASVNYRLLKEKDDVGVMKPLMDAKRCLQYIRYHAAELNIDKERIVLWGGSAGAGTALWLSVNDDLKDPGNNDPVLRESTRVRGAVLNEVQATYDILRWEEDVFTEYGWSLKEATLNNAELNMRLTSFYAIDHIQEIETSSVSQYRESVDMVSLMSPDDPEFWVSNVIQDVVAPQNLTILYHHAYHARLLMTKANAEGIPVVAYYGKRGEAYADPSGESILEFLIRKLNE